MTNKEFLTIALVDANNQYLNIGDKVRVETDNKTPDRGYLVFYTTIRIIKQGLSPFVDFAYNKVTKIDSFPEGINMSEACPHDVSYESEINVKNKKYCFSTMCLKENTEIIDSVIHPKVV